MTRVPHKLEPFYKQISVWSIERDKLIVKSNQQNNHYLTATFERLDELINLRIGHLLVNVAQIISGKIVRLLNMKAPDL